MNTLLSCLLSIRRATCPAFATEARQLALSPRLQGGAAAGVKGFVGQPHRHLSGAIHKQHICDFRGGLQPGTLHLRAQPRARVQVGSGGGGGGCLGPDPCTACSDGKPVSAARHCDCVLPKLLTRFQGVKVLPPCSARCAGGSLAAFQRALQPPPPAHTQPGIQWCRWCPHPTPT